MQFGKRRLQIFAADIARHPIQVMQQHKQAVTLGVLEQQILALALDRLDRGARVDRQADRAAKHPDPVVLMHDGVAEQRAIAADLRTAAENLRIKNALDVAEANVMLVDATVVRLDGAVETAITLGVSPSPEWTPTIPADQQLNYDPAAANQALDDAGYLDADGNGVRENDLLTPGAECFHLRR